MNSIKMALEVSNLNFDYILEQLFLLSGLFLLFAGAIELLIMILNPISYENQAFQFEMSFIYSYMVILGALLVLYHKKILVKGYRT